MKLFLEASFWTASQDTNLPYLTKLKSNISTCSGREKEEEGEEEKKENSIIRILPENTKLYLVI